MPDCFNMWNSVNKIYHSNRIKEKNHNIHRKSSWKKFIHLLDFLKLLRKLEEGNILKSEKERISMKTSQLTSHLMVKYWMFSTR